FWYVEEAANGSVLWMVDTGSGERRQIVDAAQKAILLNSLKDNEFTPRVLKENPIGGGENWVEILSPNRQWFATLEDHNFGIRKPGSNRVELLTRDGIASKPYDFMEYGFSAGNQSFDAAASPIWSSDSRYVAFHRFDLTEVPFVSVPGLTPSPWLRMTRPFEPMAKTQLLIADVQRRVVTPVQVPYDSNVYYQIGGWSPAGQLIFVRSDRYFKTAEIYLAAADTGKARLVFRERTTTFLQNHWLNYRSHTVHFVNDRRGFLWLSERDGWNHIYLYDLSAKKVTQLTQGGFPVERIVDVDQATGWIYFLAHGVDPSRPYDLHFMRVHVNRPGRLQKLTAHDGRHDVPSAKKAYMAPAPEGIWLSPDKKTFIDSHSSVHRPPMRELRAADGRLIANLQKADATKWNAVIRTPPEEFKVLAADGKTELHGVLFRPQNFDPTKTYPIIDYIYNGPFTQWVPRGFAEPGSGLPLTLAELGAVVVVIDGRGTTGRGKAFQDVVYKNFGTHEIADHAGAIRQLARRYPFIDLNRVGITGASFGGYMTFRAMVLEPDLFKVGVAFAPVYNLWTGDATNVEPYLGGDRSAFERADSLKLLGNLKGKILLIHGTSDTNALYSSTAEATGALKKAGKAFDLLTIPGGKHAYDQNVFRAILQYFDEHLVR
ncbi:MAG TPA: prolyl oligopeptidase family serine peptidase, partial [Bdellovibrionales bacterium]|nr:prolyl oligopeptidase family serine peptidase [Bdellovibrionales bacterium]